MIGPKLPAYLMIITLLSLLSSCASPENLGKARLEVSARVLYFNVENPTQQISIRNTGTPDSTLAWRISDIDPNIVISHRAQGTGRLTYNQSDTLIISTKTQALLSGASFLIRSNGGNQVVNVNFSTVPGQGLEACGSFPPKQSSSISHMKPQGKFVPGELLIKYNTPFSSSLSSQASLAQSVERDFQLQVMRPIDPYRPALVKVNGDVLQIAEQLSKDPRVTYAEPNYYLETLSTPNDPLLPEQWHLTSFGLPEAWEQQRGEGQTVVVAVIDSGFDMDHQDLVAKILPGCDFDGKDNDVNPFDAVTDRINHGTHVAGIVAATGNNALGVAGLAYGPDIKILPVKVFDDQGVTGTLENLISGILWAAGIPLEGTGINSYQADVINMSVGINLSDTTRIHSLSEALQKARNRGIVLFAASGNNSSDKQILYPAADPLVVAVGSVDEDKRRSSFSNFSSIGRSVDLMAPGGTSTSSTGCLGIKSTIPNDNYGCLSGTSMSSPFAAGTAALLLSQNPDLSPEQIISRMVNSAEFDSQFMNTREYGAGIICPDRALGLTTQCGR